MAESYSAKMRPARRPTTVSWAPSARLPIPGEIQQIGGGNVDVNGNGNSNDAFYGSENFYYFDRKLQRKRLGLNGSVQGDLGGWLQLTGDWFFTDQQQWNRTVGYQLNSSAWEGRDFRAPRGDQHGGDRHRALQRQGRLESDASTPPRSTRSGSGTWRPTPKTTSRSRPRATTTWSSTTTMAATSPASLRGLYAHAHQELVQSYVQFTDADGTAWPNSPVNAAPPGTFIYPADLGGNRVFNPGRLRAQHGACHGRYAWRSPVLHSAPEPAELPRQ